MINQLGDIRNSFYMNSFEDQSSNNSQSQTQNLLADNEVDLLDGPGMDFGYPTQQKSVSKPTNQVIILKLLEFNMYL